MASKRINLALQGGGAHGAFTWGVLDRLLEDDGIEIAAITGTSAGALNGAALKSGLISGGRAGARENLDWLWEQIGAVGDMRLTHWLSAFGAPPAMVSRVMEYSLATSVLDTAQRVFSPYYYGPFYRNPLRAVVDQLDYGKVCATEGPRFFVCATNVRTGKPRVFTGDEITTDAILASACLPTLFQAVEINDPATGRQEAYWDGGYSGNPSLHPLYEPELPRDIVLVTINPLVRDAVPVTPQDIQSRIEEVSFNAPLLRDLRAIAFVKRLLAAGTMEAGAMKDVLVHVIADDDLMKQLNATTKMLPNPVILNDLKMAGRAAADGFLAAHRDDLNVTATVDLQALYA